MLKIMYVKTSSRRIDDNGVWTFHRICAWTFMTIVKYIKSNFPPMSHQHNNILVSSGISTARW